MNTFELKDEMILDAEQEVRDALIALSNATQARQEASNWEDKMLNKFEQAEKTLEVLKKQNEIF